MATGLAALLAFAAGACAAPTGDGEWRFQAFGTSVRLTVAAAGPGAATAAARIEADFRRAERDWYAYGTGELARVNARLARGEPAPVSADLAPLIQRAIELHARSGGRFDPAVCALVRLWQFDSEEALAAAMGPPAAAEVDALRARQGTLADLRFDGRTVAADRPLCIDLGGMAKGTALAAAGRILATQGIGNALVDIGGSAQLALGRRGERPWTIGLRHPREDRVFARLALQPGESASTSGDYERGYVQDEHRYHHILDPRTGEPTAGAAAVTVVTRDPELADAASTALMVAGPRDFAAVSAALGVDVALLITTSGQLLTSPAMAVRLRHDNGGRLPEVAWPAPGDTPEL